MAVKISYWKVICGASLTVLSVFMLHGAINTTSESNEWWEQNSQKANGSVIEIRETYRNKAYCDHVVIEFNTPDNKKYTFTPDTCYSKGTFSAGRQVSIRYSKKDPSVAYVDSPSYDKATNIAIYVLCGILFISGITFIATGLKKI